MRCEYPKIQATATLFAIVLGGTDSLLEVRLKNGFAFSRINIFESDFRDKYVNANGQLIGTYCFSQLPPISDEKAHFICLTKTENIPCSIEAFTIGEMQSQHIFNTTMEKWQEEQDEYIRKILSVFRIFKDGNIEIPNVCFRFNGSYMINHLCLKSELQHMDKGEVINNFYELTDTETVDINNIIANDLYCFDLLKNAIEKFEIGCKEFRDELAFKELITVGEVLFLNYNSNDGAAKKEKLSNRLSVWVGENDLEVMTIHNDIIDYYKYRSDDTHEAENSDITERNRKKLREYIRKALKKYICRINLERQSDSTIGFYLIRKKVVLEILTVVSNYQSRGIL